LIWQIEILQATQDQINDIQLRSIQSRKETLGQIRVTNGTQREGKVFFPFNPLRGQTKEIDIFGPPKIDCFKGELTVALKSI
jgi:hypothetical protein